MKENSIYFAKKSFYDVISDIIPITDKYIERNYVNKYTHTPYIIKNKILLKELERKVKRILAWENANPNSYRQHITDIKKYLIEELKRPKENN